MTELVPSAGARELYREKYGADPPVVASAPGRVNLIGEHTDYNGGEVLPIAIAFRTAVAIGNSRNAHSSAASATESEVGIIPPGPFQPAGKWWDYVTGVAAHFSAHERPFNIAVASNVPTGAGLSSSAALEVASALAFSTLLHKSCARKTLAEIGWRAENEFVGVKSGIMDQFASAMCRPENALHIWCDSRDTENVPFPAGVLIFDTGVRRELRGSAFNERQRECADALARLRRDHPGLVHLAHATPDQVRIAGLPEPIASRALHVAGETRRVGSAVKHLREQGTVPGSLLYESHESLRDLYQCSSPELDWFVERASRAPGIEGARLTGAGWGGCAIAVGDPDRLHEAAPQLVRDYRRRFAREARVWITRAQAGAALES